MPKKYSLGAEGTESRSSDIDEGTFIVAEVEAEIGLLLFSAEY